MMHFCIHMHIENVRVKVLGILTHRLVYKVSLKIFKISLTRYARLICGHETVITLYNGYRLEVPKSHITTKSAVAEGHVCMVPRGGVGLFLLRTSVANVQKTVYVFIWCRNCRTAHISDKLVLN